MMRLARAMCSGVSATVFTTGAWSWMAEGCIAAMLAVVAAAGKDPVRALTGLDRVMVYRFDEDGHGAIIAEIYKERVTRRGYGSGAWGWKTAYKETVGI